MEIEQTGGNSGFDQLTEMEFQCQHQKYRLSNIRELDYA